ncbi:hypothetical protein QFC22_003467 [Naganishia vaughanmartiniae]|uniref:Uncharacterized protein n=1 Tax=Naganishia vaughanmartiniae TaxID=1424756 RepID=A0ACC2X913_9TREE|nr:hypothetical protein QFC22_003467 [Naganishia vaughanmartiniae]
MLTVSDDPNADVANAISGYREGDKLKAKIVSIDTETNKISFGIKPSYFSSEDFGQTDADKSTVDDKMDVSEDEEEEDAMDTDAEVDNDDDENDEDEDEMDEDDMLMLGDDASGDELEDEESGDEVR